MAGQRIRIRLKAFDHRVIDQSARDIADTIELTGEVVPLTLWEIKSEISGRVVRVNAQPGDHVTEGEVLVELDRTKLESDAQEAERLVEAADISSQQALRDLHRVERLRQSGVELLVLSTETNPVVAARCRKLALPCEQGIDDKGTRLRDTDPTRDAQLAYELQTSAKELAELVMITDLLRNDLGKVCEYGSVQVPELAKLEKFAQVQHLVSTVEGRLRKDVTHFAAFASCFPGGSITGAPKFRAMEIIDELEPISRGPYCGAIGYLGFNRESQLNIAIRTAVCKDGLTHFNVGAGIVADSNAEAEYEETLAKARGFFAALNLKVASGIPA